MWKRNYSYMLVVLVSILAELDSYATDCVLRNLHLHGWPALAVL